VREVSIYLERTLRTASRPGKLESGAWWRQSAPSFAPQHLWTANCNPQKLPRTVNKGTGTV